MPPRPIRELRDLTRYRRTLVESQGSERRRLIKLLELAGIKLAGVVSDLFGVSGRAIAAAHQPVAHQLPKPLCILHVGLAALDRLGVLRVDDDQLEAAGRFQHRKDRHPVDTGALHADLGNAQLAQPPRQPLQPGSRGHKLARQLAHPAAARADQRATDNHRAVDIQAGASGRYHFHRLPRFAKASDRGAVSSDAKNLPRVLAASVQTDGSTAATLDATLQTARASLTTGSRHRRGLRPRERSLGLS